MRCTQAHITGSCAAHQRISLAHALHTSPYHWLMRCKQAHIIGPCATMSRLTGSCAANKRISLAHALHTSAYNWLMRCKQAHITGSCAVMSRLTGGLVRCLSCNRVQRRMFPPNDLLAFVNRFTVWFLEEVLMDLWNRLTSLSRQLLLPFLNSLNYKMNFKSHGEQRLHCTPLGEADI